MHRARNTQSISLWRSLFSSITVHVAGLTNPRCESPPISSLNLSNWPKKSSPFGLRLDGWSDPNSAALCVHREMKENRLGHHSVTKTSWELRVSGVTQYALSHHSKSLGVAGKVKVEREYKEEASRRKRLWCENRAKRPVIALDTECQGL